MKRISTDLFIGEFSLGKIGKSYSLEVARYHSTCHSVVFSCFLGDTTAALYLINTLMSRVSQNTQKKSPLLSETTHFAHFNLLNITAALHTSQNILK